MTKKIVGCGEGGSESFSVDGDINNINELKAAEKIVRKAISEAANGGIITDEQKIANFLKGDEAIVLNGSEAFNPSLVRNSEIEEGEEKEETGKIEIHIQIKGKGAYVIKSADFPGYIERAFHIRQEIKDLKEALKKTKEVRQNLKKESQTLSSEEELFKLTASLNDIGNMIAIKKGAFNSRLDTIKNWIVNEVIPNELDIGIDEGRKACIVVVNNIDEKPKEEKEERLGLNERLSKFEQSLKS